jgi:hypothetical protein
MLHGPHDRPPLTRAECRDRLRIGDARRDPPLRQVQVDADARPGHCHGARGAGRHRRPDGSRRESATTGSLPPEHATALSAAPPAPVREAQLPAAGGLLAALAAPLQDAALHLGAALQLLLAPVSRLLGRHGWRLLITKRGERRPPRSHRRAETSSPAAAPRGSHSGGR